MSSTFIPSPSAYQNLQDNCIPAQLLLLDRDPNSNDKYDIGTYADNTSSGSSWQLTAYNAGVPTWTYLGAGTTDLEQLSGDTGIANPLAGVIQIAGGTGITTAASGNVVTVNMDTPVSVANGGTGATSFNINGVVISNTTSTGALASLSLDDGEIVIGSSVGPPAAATLTAGSNISIVNGPNTITISASGGGGGGLTWQNIGSSGAVSVDNGYFSTAAVTLTLPASPSDGDSLGFIASTADTLIIQANTGQVIQVNASASSSAGTATNTAIGDSLNLVYQSSTSKWFSFSTGGNWTTA